MTPPCSHIIFYACLKRFYRVLPEHQALAVRTLKGACQKLTRGQFYQARLTVINHFTSEVLKKTFPKHVIVNDGPPEMTMDDFKGVSILEMRLYVDAKLQLHYLFFT